MTITLYIVLGLILLYLIGCIFTFFISLNNYNNNLKKIENNEDYKDILEDFKKENKWKKIIKPIWYSWISVFVWIKFSKKSSI